MTTPVILHFTPNQQDYAKVLRLFFIQRTSTRISLGFLAVAFVLICYGVIARGVSPSIFELIWLLLPPLFVAYVFFGQPARMAKQAVQNEQLVTEATWQVGEAGVEISSRFGSMLMGWDTLKRMVTTKEYYLLLSKVNKNAFRFLPQRAFSSPDDKERFLALVRQHLPSA